MKKNNNAVLYSLFWPVSLVRDFIRLRLRLEWARNPCKSFSLFFSFRTVDRVLQVLGELVGCYESRLEE